MNTLQFPASKRQCNKPCEVAVYGTFTGLMEGANLPPVFLDLLHFKRSFFGQLGIRDPCRFPSYTPTGGSGRINTRFDRWGPAALQSLARTG
jgi:hypothetical protein